MFCQVRGVLTELTLHHSALLVGTDLATEFSKSETDILAIVHVTKLLALVEGLCPQ